MNLKTKDMRSSFWAKAFCYDSQNSGFRLRTSALIIILITLSALAYLPTAWNGFVRYDDDDYILNNRFVMQGLTPESVRWAFTSFHAANWHPLTWLSHMLDVELFGTWAGGHHLMSVAIHICNALLLMLFLSQTTGCSQAGFLVATLFAVHPLHVESVAWASERKDVLSAFFWFATMLAYTNYTKRPNAWRYMLVMVLFGVGLMSKPMLVTLPIVLILLDYWPLERFDVLWKNRRIHAEGIRFSRLIIEKLPFLLLAAVSSFITIKAQTSAIAAIETFGFWQRLANAVVSYGRYAWAMFWPTKLSVFYPFATPFFFAKLVGSVLFLSVVTIIATSIARKRKYVFVGWLWYLVTLVPVIGLVQVGWQSHADRYTYIPLTGLFIAIVWTAMDFASRRAISPRIITAISSGVLAVLMVLTIRQTRYWRDELVLFQHAVESTKHNPAMLANLGTVMGERGMINEGLMALKEAAQSMPNNDRVLAATGRLLLNSGRYKEAIDYFARSFEIQPHNRQAQIGMAEALARSGRLSEAELYCRRAIELEPDAGDAYNLLGIILGQMGRIEESMKAFVMAANAKKPVATARLNIAKIHAERGNLAQAVEECRLSMLAEPHYAGYQFLAGLLVQMNRLDEAERAYKKALELAPAMAVIHFNLGQLLISQGRILEALDELQAAASLEPENKDYQQYLQQLKAQMP